MPSATEVVVGASSSLARLSAFVFLKWIPGHHFPLIIIATVTVYLSCVFGKSDSFGSSRPTLHEAFPRLFPRPEHEEGSGEKDDPSANSDEPILYQDEKLFFKIFLFGIPDWRRAEWSYLSIGLNTILALFTLDLVFRGPLLYPARGLSFTRVGYIGPTMAKVLLREPDPAQLPMYVYLSPADKVEWTTTETLYYLGPDTDYTYAINFEGLQPGKKYIYSLSNDKTGTFITAPAPYSEAANSVTFLTSSCIKANFPYRPLSHALAVPGFNYLSKVVKILPSPASFMLFLGDFIYVDVPLRLSSSLSHYRSEYRRVYASPSWKLPGLDTLPWVHTLDDHEIANDWSGGNDTAPFPAASDPFIHYHVSVNPPLPPRSQAGPEANTTYFQFSNGPASFFMLDTRRYRTDPEPSSSTAPNKPLYGASEKSSNPPLPPPSHHTMLGPAQLASLLGFLSTPEPPHVHWKIVASSVPFTKNWRFGTSDTWGGFLSERAQVLAAMHAAERDLGVRVVILSGDRHEFAAIRFPPPIAQFAPPSTSSSSRSSGGTGADPHSPEMGGELVYDRTAHAGPHEFSVGPLSMFYLPIRTFRQVDDEDVAIQYLPDGNSKLGVVEIRNRDAAARARVVAQNAGSFAGRDSVLTYSLYIDGKCAWQYELASPGPGATRSGFWAGGGFGWAKARGRGRWLWD